MPLFGSSRMSELTATKAAISACSKRVNRIPLSTYRLQLGADLTLDQVHDLLPYLQKLELAISICLRCFERGRKAATGMTSLTTERLIRRLATLPLSSAWRPPHVKRTWEFCSTSCQTTWASTIRAIRGG